MSDLADASLVLAAIDPNDALHARADAHIRGQTPLTVPLSVALEVFLVARRRQLPLSETLVSITERFLVEREDTLAIAADAVDTGEVPTVFDAVHLADALLRRTSLHTADRRLLRSEFPTTPF